MVSAPLPLEAAPITFGTDGWRGILGVDITVERLLPVAAAAARELASSAPEDSARKPDAPTMPLTIQRGRVGRLPLSPTKAIDITTAQ